MAFIYTLVGEHAVATRQTLYRHWPTPTELRAELVLTGPDVGYPSPNTDPAVVATEFLTSLRGDMNDPTTAAIVIALADHDTHSSDALAAVADNRRVALNTLLSSTDRSVSPDEFARLVGPVLFQRFLARQPGTDQLIHTTVAAWLDNLTPS